MHLARLAPIAFAAALVVSTVAHAEDWVVPATVTPAAQLSVAFTGIEAKQGSIMLALYHEAGWAGGKPIRVAMIDAGIADPATLFSGLQPAATR